MSEGQSIALFNFFLFSLISSVLFFYIFVLHKKIDYLFLIIIFSTLPVLSIFRGGSYESGDLSIHVGYALSFLESLKAGHFIPVWSQELNSGYGYPLFGFSYILPYYFASFFYSLGLSMLLSTKIVFALSYIGSGLAMYSFVKVELKNKFVAFGAAILYLFAPYHLSDFHFRADIGEMVSFLFIPIVFLVTKLLSQNKSALLFILSTLSVFFLLLSHQAASLITVPFVVLYIVMLCKNKFSSIVSLCFGLGLSSFYWLPLVVEKKYTHPSTLDFSFLYLPDILYSPFMFGFLNQGPQGQLVFPIGYIHLTLIITTTGLWFFKNKFIDKKSATFFFFCGLTCLIMTQEISSSLWEAMPIMQNLQFSYRMMIAGIFFIAAYASIAFLFLNKKIGFLIILLAIGSTVLNWSNRNMLNEANDNTIYNQVRSGSIGLNPALPKWTPNWKTENANVENYETENFALNEIRNYPEEKLYRINIEEAALFNLPLSYFPGWTVKYNDRIIQSWPDKKGLITFCLPSGEGILSVQYEGTDIRKVSRIISLLFILTIIFYALILKSYTSKSFHKR